MNVQDEDETDFDCRRSKGQRELEDDFKKAKKRFPLLLSFVINTQSLTFIPRQAMMDNIGVLVATVIMVLMALTIVTLKVTT